MYNKKKIQIFVMNLNILYLLTIVTQNVDTMSLQSIYPETKACRVVEHFKVIAKLWVFKTV